MAYILTSGQVLLQYALVGWMLARAPISPAQGLHHHGPRYFNFPFSVRCVALRNLDLLTETLIKAESIEVALDIME